MRTHYPNTINYSTQNYNVKRRAREPVNSGHRHHVAGGQFAEHPVKLAPVGPRAGRLLAVDVPAGASRLAKLLKLAVEGLPESGYAGIAERGFSR